MTAPFADQGNGTAPVKRGRGRPPKPRAPLEAFTTKQFRAAMREADQIAETQARTIEQLIAQRERDGLHPQAFRLTRRLIKAGPTEARRFYEILGRYLTAAGMIE